VFASTTSGPIRGLLEHGVSVFRGIRYAAPPIGALRFKPPARPDAWSTPADCTQFGPIAPQPEVQLGRGSRLQGVDDDVSTTHSSAAGKSSTSRMTT
jgi:para-nitrobenzyl esterase